VHDLKRKLNYNSIKCFFDCANGASVDVVRNVFTGQEIIGDEATGRYINDGCGAICLEKLKKLCKKNKKIGFAFDGDADRVVAIDEYGEVIDGDMILYILATQMIGYGDRVVGTQISSMALENSLKDLGIKLIKEKVGAKFVGEKMIKEKILLGGERCGHIFLNKFYSDGVAIAIELLNILNRTKMSFVELLKGYKNTFICNENLEVGDICISNYESINNGIRVVVRKSNTESVLRILVEGEDELGVKEKINEIKNSFGAS
ncbi:MAG: hypothetical protein ACLRFE_00220, partial [Clostridia bacterium]